MRTTSPAALGRRLAPIATAVALLAAVAACAPGPAGDGPDAVVDQAIAGLAAKDMEGVRALACAGQEDIVREQLGLPDAVGDELIPGLDTEALLDAVRFDVAGLESGEPAIEGDVAQVPVTGTLKVTFDAAAMKPILREVLEQQGTSMTDEQLDALLTTLEAYGQDVPVDQSVRLVREAGAWKICQETLEAPAAS
jgi:hypothetical protein